MSWRRTPKCGRCGRPIPSGKCRVCSAVERGHTAATRKRGVDPAPHPCPRPGCGRTVRNGVCPGPDC